MRVITRLEPTEAPTSPRRIAEAAMKAGYDVLVSEARDPQTGARAWGVVGAHESGDRRFQAFWAQTPEGGCKAVGQVVDEGAGARPVKSRELTAWFAA